RPLTKLPAGRGLRSRVWRLYPVRNKKREAIEVVVLDDRDEPLPDIEVELAKGPDQVIRQKTDAYGRTRFDGLLAGSYQLTLPSTDRDAWLEIRVESLGDKKPSSDDAKWSSPPAAKGVEDHEVVLGDCFASIAFKHGWLEDSLWDHEINHDL